MFDADALIAKINLTNQLILPTGVIFYLCNSMSVNLNTDVKPLFLKVSGVDDKFYYFDKLAYRIISSRSIIYEDNIRDYDKGINSLKNFVNAKPKNNIVSVCPTQDTITYQSYRIEKAKIKRNSKDVYFEKLIKDAVEFDTLYMLYRNSPIIYSYYGGQV